MNEINDKLHGTDILGQSDMSASSHSEVPMAGQRLSWHKPSFHHIGVEAVKSFNAVSGDSGTLS